MHRFKSGLRLFKTPISRGFLLFFFPCDAHVSLSFCPFSFFVKNILLFYEHRFRPFKIGYRGVFQRQEDFLDCLKSIGRNSFWERRSSRNLRLVAITSGSKIEEELKEKYADEGLDKDIITPHFKIASIADSFPCSVRR